MSNEIELVEMSRGGSMKTRGCRVCCWVCCVGVLVLSLLLCVGGPVFYVELFQPLFTHEVDKV